MSHPYQRLFRTPSLKQAYLSVLLSAIPLGTITLALILSVESWTGSLPLAGSITALFTLGNAIGLTVQGILIDRLGDRIVVLTAGLISGLTLGLVAIFGDSLTYNLLGVTVLISGVSVPAITTAVRRSLPLLTEDPAIRSAGYAALSVVFRLAFAIGPLLVSLAVSGDWPRHHRVAGGGGHDRERCGNLRLRRPSPAPSPDGTQRSSTRYQHAAAAAGAVRGGRVHRRGNRHDDGRGPRCDSSRRARGRRRRRVRGQHGG